VKDNEKKIKVHELDDAETEFIEVDVLFNMYLENYRDQRRENQMNI